MQKAKHNNIICITGGPFSRKNNVIKSIINDNPEIPVIGNIAVEMQREGIPFGERFQEELIARQIEAESKLDWGITIRGIADAYAYGNDPQNIPRGIVHRLPYKAVYYLRSYAVIRPDDFIKLRHKNEFLKETLKEAIHQDKKSLSYNYMIYGFENVNVINNSNYAIFELPKIIQNLFK